MSGHSPGAAARARSPDAEDRPCDPARARRSGAASAQHRQLELAFRTHAGWLRRALRRRFGPEAAEDLSQEAFRRLSGVGGPIAHPRALLMTIATNAARQLFRQRRRHAPDAAAWVELDEEASWQAQEQDSKVLLKQLILALPSGLQDVFVLHRFEGLTYPEIAQRLGISTKTVEWRMSKALEICAARLRE